jgi:spermidine/putrescine transport system substrate-binding protein
MKHTTRLLGSAALLLTATAALAQDAELLVYDYAGFDNPDFHPTYTAKYSTSPTYSFFGDEEEALQKILSGYKVDMSQICAGSLPKWFEAGILEPWDISKIPEYANIDSNLTGTKLGGEGEVWFIPTYFGATAIAYNSAEVPVEDVASLNVFKNEKYSQRMTIPDNVDDAYALAYLATGVTNWTEATDAQFEAATTWLREIHPNIRTYWTDPAELAQLLATGEILVSWAWNETIPTTTGQGLPIAYQRQATEGSSVWMCGYVNLKDAPGVEDKVYDYLNALLDASSAKALLESGYAGTNKPALEALGTETLIAVGVGPVTGPVIAQLPMSVSLRERQAEAFEKIKAGF